ncbi:MAG: phosphotransferase [Anaerolineae bacterium]|nr:phosphotransferase [Anaerolineae bacterium]
MNTQIQNIIAQVPAWQTAHHITVEPQGGGLTNENYMITVDGERFVLRLSGENTAVQAINRRTERDALLAASRIGVAPEVILFILPEGHLITRLIEGRAWSVAEFQQPQVIRRVAETMRRVHALPPIEGMFSPYRDVEKRLAIAKTRQIALPDQLELFLERMVQIEVARAAEIDSHLVLCHNDPFYNNFLDDGTVRLLDWEFAGMGDRFYDLASVAHLLPPEQRTYLLECYFGQATPEAVAAMEQMWFMVAFWNGTWALLQIGTSYSDHDYRAMADHIFARMAARL